MDERRFDDLTRALGRATTRRQVLKGLLGGLAAALVPAVIARDAAPAAAAPPPAGTPPPPCDNASQALCDERATRFQQVMINQCAGLTTPTESPQGAFAEVQACLNAAAIVGAKLHRECRQIVPCDAAKCQHCTDAGCQSTCVAPATCNGSGGCVCPNGQPACNGQCPDLQTDPANCGACGHACPAGSTCVAGVCCVGAGGACATTSDCCFGQCNNGHCCLPDGGFCATGSDCCSGKCGSDGKCFTCVQDGQSCTADAQCCSGSCGPGGTCGACAGTGQPCTQWDQCCGDDSCYDNSTPGNPGCTQVVCGGITCPKPSQPYHKAICNTCGPTPVCDIGCFATTSFDSQTGIAYCCSGYNAWGGPNYCATTVPCQGSRQACFGASCP